MLSQGVAGSSLDQGSTPTPPTRSFVSQVKPAFLPLIALRLRDTWFVYEVDPVVHEPLYPLDGVACEAECDALSAILIVERDTPSDIGV